MKKKAKQKNMSMTRGADLVKTPGDGDCFYYAFLLDAGMIEPQNLWSRGNAAPIAREKARFLRRILLHELGGRTNAEKRFGFSRGQYDAVKQRLETREYAEAEELQVASTVFGLRICVHGEQGRDWVWDSVAPDLSYGYENARRCSSLQCNADGGVVLMQLQGLHYSALLWRSRWCVRALRARVAGVLEKSSKKYGLHEAARGAGVLDKSSKKRGLEKASVCETTVLNALAAYAEARRTAKGVWNEDLLAHLKALRARTLADLRRACARLRQSFPDLTCSCNTHGDSLITSLKHFCRSLDGLLRNEATATENPSVMWAMEKLLIAAQDFENFTSFARDLRK